MGRAPGVRNERYAEKRQELLDAVTDYVLRDDVMTPSLRQIAIAAGVSDPTVKHYFGDRTALVRDVLANVGARSEPLREEIRKGKPSIGEAIEDYLQLMATVPQNSMIVRANLFALRESLIEPSIFKTYIDLVVEPNIGALAERLMSSSGGPGNYANARAAAGMITSNLSMISLRHIMLGESDQVSMTVEERVSLTMNWICNGLLNDPDAIGLQRVE